LHIAITSTVLGIVLFSCLYLGFRTGLRLGMTTAKGEVPEAIKTPIQVIGEYREAQHMKQEMEKEKEEWEQIEQYDGWTDEERALNNKGVIE
jgi:hypothetical protein